MNDRLVTAAGAVLALLIVYSVFFHKAQEAPATRPLSTESGRNGYSAIRTWLESGGVPVVSLQQRFDVLIERGERSSGAVRGLAETGNIALPETGNILITTMPHLLPMRAVEPQSLRAWVRGGNTLLLLAALDDTPEWSEQSATERFLADVESMSGLEPLPQVGDDSVAGREGGAADSGDSSPQRNRGPADAGGGARVLVQPDTPVEFEPVAAHPLMDGVETLRGFSDEESALWGASALSGRFSDRLALRLAVERTSGVDAAWQLQFDEGSVIVVASGSLLTNHMVAESDSGRFLANVVRHHLGEGGAVIFDDMHQGLSALYDPAAFYRDPRLRYTVLFLVAAWLIYLLGSSNRLAPPTSPSAAPRQGDFLAAAGGFMARRLDRRDAGRALLEEWFDEIRRARGLPAGSDPPWEELRATPTLGADLYARLRQSYEALNNGRPVGLVRLHNTLRRAREAIG